MTDEDKKEVNDIDELEMDDLDDQQDSNTAQSFDDDIDDEFEEFENDFDAQDHGVKKSGGSKGILVLLIVLVGLGGAGYFFLGKSLPFMGKSPAANPATDSHMASPSIPPAPTATTQVDDPNAPFPPPPMPTPIGPDTGMNEGMNGEVSEMTDIAPMPMAPDMGEKAEGEQLIEDMASDDTPAEADVAEAPALPDADMPAVAEESAQEDIVDVPAFPDIIEAEAPAETEKVEEEKTNELVTEEELMPATIPASAPSTAEADMRVEALEKTIQAINTRLDDISQTTKSLETASPAPVMDTGDKEKLDMLSQQMLQITHRLDQLSEKIDAVEKTASSKATATPSVSKKAPEPVAKAPAEVKKPAPAPAPVAKKAAPAPTSTSPWVLRSAQPDVAWLSKAGSNEMQRYTVGQTIPNFGTIQSISQVDGKWVVRTTGGVIKQ